MENELLVIENEIAMTTTRIVAKGCNVEHNAALKLAKKYSETMVNVVDKTFGFQIRKFKTAGRGGEEVLLSERQATFLVTLMKNTPIVVEFKARLVVAFDEQRLIISRLVSQRDNPDWQDVRRDGKIIYKQKTDIIKDFVTYATGQGSRSAKMYYLSIAKMENSALFFFEQKYKNLRETLTIRQLMQVSTADGVIEKALQEGMADDLPYKDCYKLAKSRVLSFVEIIGRSPVLEIGQVGGDNRRIE